MRQGLKNQKSQLTEWVSQASRKEPPSLDQPPKNMGDEDKEKVLDEDAPVVIDKKDPILLALEKETKNFDPNVYLNKNEAAIEGE